MINTKRNFSISDSDNEITEFLRFIVIKSLLAKLSPFLIKKVISSRMKSEWNKSGNLLVKVDTKKHANNWIKMKTFHNLNCNVYPHESLSTEREFWGTGTFLTTPEEIKTVLEKQKGHGLHIKKYKHSYTSNKSIILKEMKIGYCLERVEQYVLALLRCFKCHKYGHLWESCRKRLTCGRCSQREPNHIKEDCPNKTKYQNCQEKQYRIFKILRHIYKREREIMEIKYKRNVFKSGK